MTKRHVFGQPGYLRLWNSILFLPLFFAVACNSGGKIEFKDGVRAGKTGVSAVSLVPASQALAIESGKNVANGYHAKLELNPIKGQNLSAAGGYKMRVRHSGRSR